MVIKLLKKIWPLISIFCIGLTAMVLLPLVESSNKRIIPFIFISLCLATVSYVMVYLEKILKNK